MGLVPYIQTGAEHSAAGMNDLYDALDGVLNTMSSNKSLYFMNGFSRYAEPQSYTLDAGMYGEQTDEFHFGLSHSREERTSSTKKYYFLDGCKALDYTGQCVRHWDGGTHEDGTPGPIDAEYTEYKSEEDCLSKHCGNYKNCTAEALIPAGEWGWWYKLIGQYGYGGEQQEEMVSSEIITMPFGDEVGEINDYEKIIAPLMDAWEVAFFPIDVHPEQNLILGIENSIMVGGAESCDECNEGKWMDIMEDMCAPGSNPCEVIGQMNVYPSYIACHFDKCPEVSPLDSLHGSGSVWDLNFTKQIGCDVAPGVSVPCPCGVKEIRAPYCTNLQHALHVPQINDEFILYEFKYPKIVAGAQDDDDAGTGGDGGDMGGMEPCSSCAGDYWEFDWNGPNYENHFQTQQGCYSFYCDPPPEANLGPDSECCALVDSSDDDEDEEEEDFLGINKIIYTLEDARLISLDDATYFSKTFNRPEGPFAEGKPRKWATDSFRFEHQGWCWDDTTDARAYNDPNCEKEWQYAGKPPPITPICDQGCFGFLWGCDFMPCPAVGCPVAGVPDHLPNLEHRFVPAELIFDGKREKYQKFKFSNKYNKFKFFRVHNLNNYDMEFEFEPDEGLEEAEFVSRGIWKKGEEKFVVGECSAGTGTKFKIPRHESRCVRRDWGDYVTGSNNFQKFLEGDVLYQLELSEAENALSQAYPHYYDYYDKTELYISRAKSNNIANPFIIDDYIKKFQGRFQMDPHGPRVWDSSGLYMGAGQKIATEKDVATPPKRHWDPNLDNPEKVGDVMGEFPGTRSYDGVGVMSMSGYQSNDTFGRSSYALMTQPSHANFYQGITDFTLDDLANIATRCATSDDVIGCLADELYVPVKELIERAGDCLEDAGDIPALIECAKGALAAFGDKPRVALDNQDSVIADFLYHTGWILQTTNIKSGMWTEDSCPSCMEKTLVPYRGARLVHDFINNMNVNVLPIEPSYMTTINFGDYGLSGFTAAPFAFFDVSAHFNDDNDLGGATQAESDAYPAALQGGSSPFGHKSWQGMPSYTNALALMIAVDPVNDPGYSGIGPIKSTQLDYGSDELGPKHLRYVRHHGFSPNSGDWVKTVGKQFGFWGKLKERSKWVYESAEDGIVIDHALETRRTLACSGLQEDIRDDWFERARIAEIGFSNPPLAGRTKKGYSFEVQCGDGESLGFETTQVCEDLISQGTLTLPTVYVLAEDEEEALDEAVKECTKWNRKRGVEEDCVEGNIDEGSLVEKPNVNTPGGPGHNNYGSVWTTPPRQIPPWANDNPDPYAYSIHQMAVSTNILGQNSWNHLKGQLYPVPSIHQERLSSDQCMAPAQRILNSHIDFINTHDVKIGSYFYANLPQPFGTKNLYLAMQGYEVSVSSQPLPYCYPLKRSLLGGRGSLVMGDVAGQWGGTEGHCWGRTISDTSDFDMDEAQRGPFEDCPSWTNMGAAFTLGFYSPRLYDPGDNNQGRLMDYPYANSDMFKDSHDSPIDWKVPFNGVVNHKMEPQCPWENTEEDIAAGIDNDWRGRGKVELSSVAEKFVDEEWRKRIGHKSLYFAADWETMDAGSMEGLEYPTNETNIAVTSISQYEAAGGSNTADSPEIELFVDGEAWFDYAETVDEGTKSNGDVEENDLSAAHHYKYSFWHAIPRGHLIYNGHFMGHYNKFFKVGFDCTLADMFDKDWLGCGLPAAWRPHETQEPQDGYPWKLWPTHAEYSPEWSLFQYGVIPFIKSHIIPISGGYVQDVPITEWKDDRFMPLVFKHDYSKVGEDHSYYGYIDFDEDGKGINKAKTSFEARRDMFSMTLKDIHEGIKEFNKYDGTHAGGGYWTGYTGVAPFDPTLAGDNAYDLPMEAGWDGSEREGPHNGYPYLERRFMGGIEPMPIFGSSNPLETYELNYKSCCTEHCVGSQGWYGPTDEWAAANEDKVTDDCNPDAGLPCFYLSEAFCREGELAAGRCGTFYSDDWTDLEPEIREKRTLAMKNGCRERAEKLAGRRYETITAMSPPGGFETEDSFNYGKLEKDEDKPEGASRISESSYKEEFFDNSASLNYWQFDYESSEDYEDKDANEMFYEELHKMYLEDGDPETDLGNPFDGNYMKPIYGEYGKFSYSWQKNLNLRYKFSENFQSWGSDHMGRIRSYEGAYDNSYQMSKAVGVGYDEDQVELEKSTSPILYSRYYRPITSNRTPFGGLQAELIIPPDQWGPSLIQLTNTRLHKDESAEYYGMGTENFTINTTGPLQHSMSWFWNTNRVQEGWSALEPHCDSEFLTGRMVTGPNLGPPGGALYHPTGIIWNHPDLYIKEVRKEHIISAHKGKRSVNEKNIIGFHKEFSSIDEKFRFGRAHTQCKDSMPAGNRYMQFTDIEGATSITWDQHLSEYGPPRRAYEITGVSVPKDDEGNPALKGYWPACMAVYYAQDYIVKEDNDRVSADACLKKFFGGQVGFTVGAGIDTNDFIDYWIQYKDYCPTLRFTRWNEESPHDYTNPMFADNPKGHVHAHREMDIVPRGFPNINCKGEIDDVRLFEVVQDTMHKNSDEEYTTYDECQACSYTWDHGSWDSRGRYGSGGTIKGIEDLKEENPEVPDIRSDFMYRPAGIPHFYDYEPKMFIEPPALWPPPFVDADWEAMSTAIGCEENMIRPDKIIETMPESNTSSTRLRAGSQMQLMEHWTGVSWTSGTCGVGQEYIDDVSANNDKYLDRSHAEVQDYWMAERICADHTAPCAGFDYPTIRTIEEYGGQRPYFPAPLYSTKYWGRTMGRLCEQRVTWQNTSNVTRDRPAAGIPDLTQGQADGTITREGDASRVVKLAFHVMNDGRELIEINAQGQEREVASSKWITQSFIDEQFEYLRSAFATNNPPTDIDFENVSTTFHNTPNTSWGLEQGISPQTPIVLGVPDTNGATYIDISPKNQNADINIYVVSQAGAIGENIRIVSFAYMMGDELVLGAKQFGGHPLDDTVLGDTLVHEIGHSLGLPHAFVTDDPQKFENKTLGSFCATSPWESYGVEDTPPQIRILWGGPGTAFMFEGTIAYGYFYDKALKFKADGITLDGLTQTSFTPAGTPPMTECGTPSASNNYMQYVDDPYMNTFTQDQVDRMEAMYDIVYK